jgi:hypothetical protein
MGRETGRVEYAPGTADLAEHAREAQSPDPFHPHGTKTSLAVRVAEKTSKGDLGVMVNFIYERHLCMVDIPKLPGAKLSVTFIGARKNGADGESRTSLTLANDPTTFNEPAAAFESPVD